MPRHPVTRSLALVVVGALVTVSLAHASVDDEPQVGDACREQNETLVFHMHGSRLLSIPGRVYTSEEGGYEQPVSKVRFWRTDMPKAVRIKTAVKKDGTFTLDTGVAWDVRGGPQILDRLAA